jgi:hypothetical protein
MWSWFKSFLTPWPPTSERFQSATEVLDGLSTCSRLPEPGRNFAGNHLITDTLRGTNQLEAYSLWKDSADGTITALARFGETMCGHPGLVHGGATAAVLDELFGSMYDSQALGKGFTANLNINYRHPIPANSEVIIHVWTHRVQGRKVFMDGIQYRSLLI